MPSFLFEEKCEFAEKAKNRELNCVKPRKQTKAYGLQFMQFEQKLCPRLQKSVETTRFLFP